MTSFEKFLDSASSNSHLRIEADLGDGYVRLRSDEADRRQAAQDIRCTEDIVIELLRNSRDAHAHTIYLALSTHDGIREVCVIDDGDGVPVNLHDVMFEPRVTSKLDTAHKDTWGLHGRGMALYSIKENALSASICVSAPHRGCSLKVTTRLSELPEKADQSSFPRFTFEKDNSITIRGPKNIQRTACEFALEERNCVTVFLGSPVEISAALYAHACEKVPFALRAFSQDSENAPYVNCPAYSADPESLKDCMLSLGLDISLRTAQRIMKGQIDSPQSLIDQIATKGFTSKEHTADRRKKTKPSDSYKVRFDEDDVQRIEHSLEEAILRLGEKYYLTRDENESASLRYKDGRLIISIPFISADPDFQ